MQRSRGVGGTKRRWLRRTSAIREHRIPSAGSGPYICVEGPDRCLWFCESGTGKIGRLDPETGAFTEFALSDPKATPIGITVGADGNLWFAQKAANKIGRITLKGEIAEFPLPTPKAGPDGMILGPDGNVWFSETEVSQIGRITPNGDITEFSDGISPGARPLSIMVRDGTLWFSEASGNRIGRITTDGKVTEFPIPSHDSQPRAMITHPDGSIWFVETSTNALGRIDRDGKITEHPVPTPNSSLRGVTVGRDGNLWYTANAANKIGCMTPDRRRARRISDPDAGERRALHRRDVGRPAVLHAMGRRPDRRSGGALTASETKSGRNVMTGILRALFCAAIVALASSANAQSYPDKPIRMIVSIAAGSVTDVIMRAAANELQPRLKQTLVIENLGGAAGILGGQACARAAPDGYTICVIYHSTMSYNPLLFTKLPYNPDTDFTPIARLFFLTEGLFASIGARREHASPSSRRKAQSGAALNYATLGEGSFPDLFLKWMNNQWNTKIVGIPYRGGGPAAQALAANDVQVTRFGVGNFTGLLEGGKVKALAVGLPARSPLLPDVPTLG